MEVHICQGLHLPTEQLLRKCRRVVFILARGFGGFRRGVQAVCRAAYEAKANAKVFAHFDGSSRRNRVAVDSEIELAIGVFGKLNDRARYQAHDFVHAHEAFAEEDTDRDFEFEDLFEVHAVRSCRKSHAEENDAS